MKPKYATQRFLFGLMIFTVVFLTNCSKDDPIEPDENGSVISKFDTLVNVDLGDAVISYEENLSIRIPQGAVNGDATLSISKIDGSSLPQDEEMVFPEVYEVTLGEQHIYDTPLEITLKFDPEQLNEGKLKYKIGAAYFDESLQRWSLFRNVSVDTLLNTVTISTNHLTKLSWYHFKYALGYTDYISSPYFIIYWSDGKVPSNAEYNSTLTNHKGSAPHYIQDILYYMEEARKVYKKENLTVPDDTTNKAEIRVLELPKGVDGNTSYFGFIRLNQNIEKNANFTQQELVQITCAHELLHYVQDYYYMWTFEGNIIKWWMEATAVQADRIVWPQNKKFEAVSYANEALDEVLGRSWDDCNLDPNWYKAGGFLTYLTTYREGAKLNIPEIIIETGKATNISYFRTILNDHLKNKLSSYGIGHEYRDYMKWAFEHKGPIHIRYIAPLSSTNAPYVAPVRLTESNSKWEQKGTVPYMAVKMVKIMNPESTGTSAFKIVCNDKDTHIEPYLYVTNRDNTTYKNYLTKGDTVKITLDQKNKWIDILCNNISNDKEGMIDLSVQLVLSPEVSSITPASAKVGETVQIKGKNFGSSPAQAEVWFGAVKALASDIVSWIDEQIDVKVPEGAETGDVHVVVEGEQSNNVTFTVTGAPVIIDIIDYTYSWKHDGIRRFTLPNNDVVIKGKSFGDYPSIKKVFINNIEAEFYNWTDTLLRAKIPEQISGNISVRLESSNGISNEFSYFAGLPISYLSTSETIKLDIEFYVMYYNAKAEKDYSRYVGTRPYNFTSDQVSWSGSQLTVNLNHIDNISGTAVYTFSEDGLNIEKVEIDYTKTDLFPNEVVHFTGENFPHSNTLDFNGYEYYDFKTCGPDLEQSTQSFSGSLNYVDDLRSDFKGIDFTKDCSWNSIFLQLMVEN